MSVNKITIVINTFKSEDKINHCLASINPDYEVIIVENSNNSNFKNEIEAKYSNVKCILAGENLGYAKGNNLGLSNVKSSYALILNPDAKLKKDTLKNFLILTEDIKDFSIIGPAKQDEYSQEDMNKEKDEIFQVDYLKGFAMFFNLEKFKDIGFFDDNFFIYLEEIDLCKRLRKLNKKIYLSKNIKIDHVGGSSHNDSINFEMELSRNWHWMWSTFYFNKKHYGFLIALFKIIRKFFSAIMRVIFYTLMFNHKKKNIYLQRLSGIFNSIIGKKSWYRPKILID
ncbi:glycosyltransferase [Pelagibacteraceae bacterium]|jgi:N-acetylglucosaminyl-diphospho-decaprenol L-rhamnosyltransferase|nr:glycosyltransferase [Pelagibacteraceae bacterium]MDC0529958.1 glycosyltransferase [Pelagibacteraceae bacterium]